jgi:hypothetical protein
MIESESDREEPESVRIYERPRSISKFARRLVGVEPEGRQ